MELFKTNHLIVEDKDIRGVTISLMRHRLFWGNEEYERPVNITDAFGKQSAIRAVPVKMKGTDVKRVGLVIDADSDLPATWSAVSNLCRKIGGNPPDICPAEGLVLVIGDQRFGVWIMPNNKLPGMVETMCYDLVPDSAQALWKFAVECAETARTKYAAPFASHYTPKAHLHTWLAWQSRPGERIGIAIKNNALGHKSEDANAFFSWFLDLFELHAWPKAV